jgi:amino acid adenylation domain-containing protein
LSRPHNALPSYLDSAQESYPEHPAIVDSEGQSLTYRELFELSGRVATFLSARGVQKGDRVAIMLPKRAKSIAILFGILRAGAICVPVDAAAPAMRCVSILRDCMVRVLFTEARLFKSLTAPMPELVSQPVVLLSGGPLDSTVGWQDVLSCQPTPASEAKLGPSDLAYILYTSGSTGKPKGVTLSHGNIASFVEWCSECFVPVHEDRFGNHAPLHFDLSILDIYLAVKHGATVYLIGEELGKEPKLLARFISRTGLTVWYSTPSILSLMAEYGRLESSGKNALRLVLFAGEVFPVKQLKKLVDKWPAPAYYNLYGPTETNVCTFARISVPIPEDRVEPYPIGQVCAHCDALVLDFAGQPVPEGEEGLLYISGAPVFQGYWGRLEEAAGHTVSRDGKRWYNTGDVVCQRSDGYHYIGRRDRMVKRHGYRIELGEIESALYRHPQIREAAVVAVAEPAGVRIAAFLSTHAESHPTLIELKQFCAGALPAYMSPDSFVFCAVLPRTSTSKVDYQALAGMVGSC